MVVLNSDQAIKDLLDKRSNIYSSRPEMYLGNVVSNFKRMLLLVSAHYRKPPWIRINCCRSHTEIRGA